MLDLLAIIREYKPEDREDVERCSLELLESQHRNQPDFWASSEKINPDECVEALLAQTEDGNGKIFVAEVDGCVVGYILATVKDIENEPGFIAKRFANVGELVVLKNHQGQGIGKALMAEGERYAKESGCMYASLRVRPGNSAIELYRKLGYEIKTHIMRKIL